MDRTETIRRMLADNDALRQQLEANLAHHRLVLAIREQRDRARRNDVVIDVASV